ncbi:P-loop ATPase, Sll1717 family [Candidatus Methylomicrobium oryzae]|uniref:P-loop ATPase, Sll1717 family n=1 Tax=Candidatus Methylomicrobium oryzae TaxID=2802053 RepID=UPI001920C9EB|nr:hypothetical protein [Methylomicrobium sp. RS1]MBL1265796.1 hypothetical protein [Methylomicrobium sp. RS1]
MSKYKGFFAYPASPREIGDVVEAATNSVVWQGINVRFSTWRALDIAGHFIAEEVTNSLESAEFVVADLTQLNFNVTYEIGFAIGRSKRVILVKNASIAEAGVRIKDVGIFDTLGYEVYQNSKELRARIDKLNKLRPIDVAHLLNQKAPVYLVEPTHKTDWAGRIVSRIKKTGYIYRSYDPNESPRLSAYEAIAQVSQSYGVVVPLLGDVSVDADIHNMRAAFIAGLAHGMEKAVCIIQNCDAPVPIDYRDFVKVTYQLNDVNEVIADFASNVAKAFQSEEPQKKRSALSFLKKLNLGATSAENEMRDLANYYLETEQYLQSLRGEAHLVVGRKGSGKSAIFLQIRDREREIDRSKNIIVDLKPDGFKLVKFKEQILSFLQEGTYQHTITAFWEYVLLLEICYKILEKDRQRHIRDHTLFEGYRELNELYNVEGYDVEGDFAERMSGLMEKVYTEYQSKYGTKDGVRLSSAQVTELLHKHDVRKLQSVLIRYMENKGILWLLFDNIDKGWPTTGLQHNDLLIIRALIDATRKIEREFGKKSLTIHTIVFLRNDVYELLVKETSDRGKEAAVVLDWTDPDLLRELVRLRIVANGLEENTDFRSAWLRMFTSHYKGEETSQYLIDRCLMRPRFLLSLINQCRSFAVNLNHDRIEESDIKKGLTAYSSDLVRDIGYELVDVSGVSDDTLYAFIGSKPIVTREDIEQLLKDYEVRDELIKPVFDLLLWYGFLGIEFEDCTRKYIYDFNYKMPLMNGIIKKNGQQLRYSINEAFWPALLIEE